MRRLFRILLGTGEGIAGTVYGTIVAMSVLVAGSDPDHIDAARLAGIVGVSAVVFWLAHVYADAIGESLHAGTRLSAQELASVARREATIPLAAVAPTVALVLGAVGVFKETTAVWVALGIGVGTLGLEGARYAAIERLGRGRTLVSIAANLALGLVIVGLKAALAH